MGDVLQQSLTRNRNARLAVKHLLPFLPLSERRAVLIAMNGEWIAWQITDYIDKLMQKYYS
jgi:hypothetical protein